METIRIIAVRDNPKYVDRAADYFAAKWGVARCIYLDSIGTSMSTNSHLPRWYLMLKDDEIIGSYGLITNDFNSRQDLWPWLAALYIEESERGSGLGARLLAHGVQEAARLGFETVYLFTDHIGYYEKYGWTYIGSGYGVDGEESRVYERGTGK